MVDISRDPRWGRVAEGGGEDPYLGSQMAKSDGFWLSRKKICLLIIPFYLCKTFCIIWSSRSR